MDWNWKLANQICKSYTPSLPIYSHFKTRGSLLASFPGLHHQQLLITYSIQKQRLTHDDISKGLLSLVLQATKISRRLCHVHGNVISWTHMGEGEFPIKNLKALLVTSCPKTKGSSLFSKFKADQCKVSLWIITIGHHFTSSIYPSVCLTSSYMMISQKAFFPCFCILQATKISRLEWSGNKANILSC